LSSLGCKINFVDEEKIRRNFRGVIAAPNSKVSCQAIYLFDDQNPIFANHYYGETYFPAIKLFFREVEECLNLPTWSIERNGQLLTPEIDNETEQSILDRMKKITFYRDASFEFREVTIDEIIPVSSFVEKFKLNQAREIFQMYKRKNLPMFHPIAIKFANGSSSTILPPVLEEKNGRLYVAEGHSRLYYLWKQDCKSKVRVIVVQGVDKFFTTIPTVWDKVILSPDKIPQGENGQLLARNIEGQFRD
jgi:hypothetical protein